MCYVLICVCIVQRLFDSDTAGEPLAGGDIAAQVQEELNKALQAVMSVLQPAETPESQPGQVCWAWLITYRVSWVLGWGVVSRL